MSTDSKNSEIKNVATKMEMSSKNDDTASDTDESNDNENNSSKKKTSDQKKQRVGVVTRYRGERQARPVANEDYYYNDIATNTTATSEDDDNADSIEEEKEKEEVVKPVPSPKKTKLKNNKKKQVVKIKKKKKSPAVQKKSELKKNKKSSNSNTKKTTPAQNSTINPKKKRKSIGASPATNDSNKEHVRKKKKKLLASTTKDSTGKNEVEIEKIPREYMLDTLLPSRPKLVYDAGQSRKERKKKSTTTTDGDQQNNKKENNKKKNTEKIKSPVDGVENENKAMTVLSAEEKFKIYKLRLRLNKESAHYIPAQKNLYKQSLFDTLSLLSITPRLCEWKSKDLYQAFTPSAQHHQAFDYDSPCVAVVSVPEESVGFVAGFRNKDIFIFPKDHHRSITTTTVANTTTTAADATTTTNSNDHPKHFELATNDQLKKLIQLNVLEKDALEFFVARSKSSNPINTLLKKPVVVKKKKNQTSTAGSTSTKTPDVKPITKTVGRDDSSIGKGTQLVMSSPEETMSSPNNMEITYYQGENNHVVTKVEQQNVLSEEIHEAAVDTGDMTTDAPLALSNDNHEKSSLCLSPIYTRANINKQTSNGDLARLLQQKQLMEFFLVLGQNELPKKQEEEVVVDRTALRSNDVVLSRGGYDKGVYRECLDIFWEIYEISTHTQKRFVVSDAIAYMIEKGVRFLSRAIISDTGHTSSSKYVIEQPESPKVCNKLLRALRQEVIDRTDHLSIPERHERQAMIENFRRKFRIWEVSIQAEKLRPLLKNLKTPPHTPFDVAKRRLDDARTSKLEAFKNTTEGRHHIETQAQHQRNMDRSYSGLQHPSPDSSIPDSQPSPPSPPPPPPAPIMLGTKPELMGQIMQYEIFRIVLRYQNFDMSKTRRDHTPLGIVLKRSENFPEIFAKPSDNCEPCISVVGVDKNSVAEQCGIIPEDIFCAPRENHTYSLISEVELRNSLYRLKEKGSSVLYVLRKTGHPVELSDEDTQEESDNDDDQDDENGAEEEEEKSDENVEEEQETNDDNNEDGEQGKDDEDDEQEENNETGEEEQAEDDEMGEEEQEKNDENRGEMQEKNDDSGGEVQEKNDDNELEEQEKNDENIEGREKNDENREERREKNDENGAEDRKMNVERNGEHKPGPPSTANFTGKTTSRDVVPTEIVTSNNERYDIEEHGPRKMLARNSDVSVSTSDSQDYEIISKDDIRTNDVILNYAGYNQGLYRQLIAKWWERYEVVPASKKREIASEVIADMVSKGVRFLSKFDTRELDGTRLNWVTSYKIIPNHSPALIRKILRALRQEVLERTAHLTSEEKHHRERFINKLRLHRRYIGVSEMMMIKSMKNVES